MLIAEILETADVELLIKRDFANAPEGELLAFAALLSAARARLAVAVAVADGLLDSAAATKKTAVAAVAAWVEPKQKG